MCDFRVNMKSEVVKHPRVGWKVTSDGYTGWAMLNRKIIPNSWMSADCEPTQRNYNGWYIYKRQPFTVRRNLWKVQYKGKCVYGNSGGYGNLGGWTYEGVRAEKVKFIEKVQ